MVKETRKPCRKCRKERSAASLNRQVERSSDGRRANRRKEQRAAKLARLAEAAKQAAIETGSSEAVSEGVMSVEQIDPNLLTHGGEVQSVEGSLSPVPGSEVVEKASKDQSVSGVPAPDVAEGLETKPVQQEGALERPVVSKWDESSAEWQI